ncbi:MAG: hypothetical protein GC182_23410 [Rhodopseudomonas sp.]|nr:hypothetical protein [Rhodopseudomonas sp.]
MPENPLSLAVRAFTAGNLPASEILCRDVLDADPHNAAALNMLGIIAANVGAVEPAEGLFQAALRAEPGNAETRQNLALLKQVPRPQSTVGTGQRYLVIKAWGFGFWSDVSQVLGSLLLAEITGRIPVTHWGKNSLFGDGTDRDAFRLYFKPVSDVTLADLSRIENATFFPAKWRKDNLFDEDITKWQGSGSRAAAIYFLNKTETVAVNDFHIGVANVAPWIPASHPMHGQSLTAIYRYLIDKYLRPLPEALAASDAFFRDNLQGAPFVAVHVRGSDKIVEDRNLDAVNQSYGAALAAIDPSWRIFLLTDDENWRTRLTDRFGNRIVTTDCQRTDSTTGVHYLPSVNRVQAGMEVMADAYLALRADRFIGNGSSNVSAMIAVMKNWPPGDCTLLGTSALMQRNLFIHVKP